MTNINTFQGDVFIHEYIKHTGDDNNLFGFSGTDTFKIATGGTDRLTINSSGTVTIAGTLTATGQVKGATVVGTHYGTISGSNTAAVTTLTASAMVKAATISGTNVYGTLAGSNTAAVSSLTASGQVKGATVVGTSGVYGTISGSNAATVSSLNAGSGTITTTGQVKGVTVVGTSGVYGTISGSNAAAVSSLTATGSVGIGTNSPQYKLDVNAGTDIMFRLMSSVDTSGKMIFGRTGNQDLRSHAIEVYNSGGNEGENNYMKFLVHDGTDSQPYETRTEVMTLLGDGNVGIGKADPSYALDVVGDVAISSNLAVDTNTLFVDSVGNKVGIGTTSPSHALNVKAASGDAEVHIQAQGNDGGDAIIYFNGSSTNQRKCAIISSNIAPNSYCKQDLHFCMETTGDLSDVDITDSKMVLTNAGNVGIGVTDPLNILHLSSDNTSLDASGSATFDKYSLIIHNTRGSGSTDTELGLCFSHFDTSYPSSAITPGAAITHERTDLWSKGKLHFKTKSANTEAGSCDTRMTIDESGNVGIGTTSPGHPLDVQFTGDSGIRSKNSGSSHASVYIDSGSGYSYLRFESSGAAKFWVQSTPTGDLAFRPSGGGHVMDIKNNGNVGIGTSDPNHKLEVSGGILADYIAIHVLNLHGARFGKIIEYRYSGMPSSAPTDESSMNSEFGNRSPTATIYMPEQMRYPYGSGATNIAHMWIGIIQATSTGVYTFGVNSDDAGDLFVAGYRVADWYAGHGHNTTITIPGGNQRTIYLKGGEWYKVKARFEENAGGEAFFALWKKPGDTSFSEIPSSNLGYLLGDTPGNVVTSDDRLKVNETIISNATDTIIKLKPQIYDKFESIQDVHDTKNQPIRESGLIAQDIWYDTPELRHMVYPYKTPNETRQVNEDIQQDPDYSDWGPVAAQVNYFGVIPYLIKSFQELHEKVIAEKVKTQQIDADLQAEKVKTKNLEALVLTLISRVQKLETR